jgi:hypothetical protein
MAELLHWLTASTGAKQTTDKALTAPLHRTTTTNSEKATHRNALHHNVNTNTTTFTIHYSAFPAIYSYEQWHQWIALEYLDGSTLSSVALLSHFKFNTYFGCIYYTEQHQFVHYINTSINEVFRSSRKNLCHLLSFKSFNAYGKREGP